MAVTISFTVEDNGNFTLTVPTSMVEALGYHAMMGDAIRMQFAKAAQQRKIEVPDLSFVGGNVAPFGRK